MIFKRKPRYVNSDLEDIRKASRSMEWVIDFYMGQFFNRAKMGLFEFLEKIKDKDVILAYKYEDQERRGWVECYLVEDFTVYFYEWQWWTKDKDAGI